MRDFQENTEPCCERYSCQWWLFPSSSFPWLPALFSLFVEYLPGVWKPKTTCDTNRRMHQTWTSINFSTKTYKTQKSPTQSSFNEAITYGENSLSWRSGNLFSITHPCWPWGVPCLTARAWLTGGAWANDGTRSPTTQELVSIRRHFIRSLPNNTRNKKKCSNKQQLLHFFSIIFLRKSHILFLGIRE